MMRSTAVGLWVVLGLVGCRKTPTTPPTPVEPAPAVVPVDVQPERASGCRADVPEVTSTGGLVVAAHPEAAAIGAQVLRDGGNAMDAALAVAVALTLVEPQSSGIGGGAFLLHYDAASAELTAWDGREVAPAAADPSYFLVDGAPAPWPEMVAGGRSVGVPGLVRMLEAAHEAHGVWPWGALWQPTAELAEAGFAVTPRMHGSIEGIGQTPMNVLARDAAAAAYFLPDGEPLPVGHVLKNPALAETVRRIAAEGADAFYTGPMAEIMVARVQQASDNPGIVTADDFAAYRAVRRAPVCVPFAGRSVCGHPPPTSGGVTTLQILGLLEADGATTTPHHFVEAARLAWADRGRYLADPDAVAVPTEALLDSAYLASRAASIGSTRGPTPSPGEVALPAAPTEPLCSEGRDTTHLVVVDGEGNAVSMTSSIENAFGSGLFVEGFLLNNQLTDFDFAPTRDDGSAVANRVQACKRPRSSMSPLIVLGANGVELAVGSPGGSRIIQYTARVVVDVLEHGASVHEAIARPNLVSRGDHVEVEDGCGTPAPTVDLQVLTDGAHPVVRTELNSGLHGVERTAEGWRAGIDPRREGAAVAVE